MRQLMNITQNYELMSTLSYLQIPETEFIKENELNFIIQNAEGVKKLVKKIFYLWKKILKCRSMTCLKTNKNSNLTRITGLQSLF